MSEAKRSGMGQEEKPVVRSGGPGSSALEAPGGKSSGQPSSEGGASPPDPGRSLEHILICLDRSALSEGVLPYAVSLAECCGAQLTLLHVLEPLREGRGATPADALEWEIVREEARQYLELTRDKVRRAGLGVETRLRQGRAAEQILQALREESVDLAMLASHGVSGLSRWNLSSTVQKVISRAHRSVMVVPAGSRPARSTGFPYANILVPLDGSLRAECVLPMVVRIARERPAEVHLMHTVPAVEMPLWRLTAREDRDLARRLEARNAEVARQYLENLRERLRQEGVSARPVLHRGSDVREILSATLAGSRPDLIVVAAHGRTGSCELPYGNTANYLIGHANVPLLVIQDLTPAEIDRFHQGPRQHSPRRTGLYHEENV